AGVTTIDRRGVLRERSPDDYEIGYRSVVLRPIPPNPSLEKGGDIRTPISKDGDIETSIAGGGHINTPPFSKWGRGDSDEWFVAARFRLARGDGEDSRRKVKELLTRRIATQPLAQPNAGSVFRNP